jgi:hypothetical protein
MMKLYTGRHILPQCPFQEKSIGETRQFSAGIKRLAAFEARGDFPPAPEFSPAF